MGYPHASRDEVNEGEIHVFDGVGALLRGDLLTILYARDAILPRTRWAFELFDRCCRRSPNGILVMMLVPASSRPPDAETRAFMYREWRRVEALLRLQVTVPEGSPFHRSMVRLVMGAHIMLHLQRHTHRVADDVGGAIQLIRKAASNLTPMDLQITRDIAAVRAELDGRPHPSSPA